MITASAYFNLLTLPFFIINTSNTTLVNKQFKSAKVNSAKTQNCETELDSSSDLGKSAFYNNDTLSVIQRKINSVYEQNMESVYELRNENKELRVENKEMRQENKEMRMENKELRDQLLKYIETSRRTKSSRGPLNNFSRLFGIFSNPAIPHSRTPLLIPNDRNAYNVNSPFLTDTSSPAMMNQYPYTGYPTFRNLGSSNRISLAPIERHGTTSRLQTETLDFSDDNFISHASRLHNPI